MTISDYVRRSVAGVTACAIAGMLVSAFGVVSATEDGTVAYACDNYAQAAIKPHYKFGKTFDRWMIEVDGYHKHINTPVDPILVAVTASVYSVAGKVDKNSAYRVAYNVCESMHRDPLTIARNE